MKRSVLPCLILLSCSLVLAGCQKAADKAAGNDEKEELEIKAARAQLDAHEQRMVDDQDRCPISGDRLGSMGKPYKLSIKGQSVFLCCKGCRQEALDNEEGTLAKVEEMKAKAKKPAP